MTNYHVTELQQETSTDSECRQGFDEDAEHAPKETETRAWLNVPTLQAQVQSSIIVHEIQRDIILVSSISPHVN